MPTEFEKNFNMTKEDALFDDDSNVVHEIISIRKVMLPNNGLCWEVLRDKKVIISINSNRLTKKERSFLSSVDGMQFLIAQIKSGVFKLKDIKSNIKKIKL